MVPSVLLAAAASEACAALASLSAVADTSLYSESSGLSNGRGTGLFAGVTNRNDERRGLLRFDFSGIPPDARITSVSLELRVTMKRFLAPATVAIDLHRLTRDWGEGTSDAPGQEGGGGDAEPGDATWGSAILGTADWTRGGGDFENVASARAFVEGIGSTATWTDPRMVDDVQGWVDGMTSNHGWILRQAIPGTGQARRFGSREHPEKAPRLTVEYATGTTPQSITFTAPESHTLGEGPIALNATASSGLAVHYRVVSGPGSIDGAVLSFTGDGAVVVEAGQPGDDQFAEAGPVEQTIRVRTLFAEWWDLHFSTTEQGVTELSGDLADPDGDGRPNLLEFALQADPRSPDRIEWDRATMTPEGALVWDFPRDTRFRTVDILLEQTMQPGSAGWIPVVTSLGGGSPSGSGFDGETGDGFARRVVIRIPLDGERRLFLRLRVVRRAVP